MKHLPAFRLALGLAMLSVTLTAYADPEYTVLSRATAGGAISPSGEIQVAEGADQAFLIQANTGYEIADVLVDDVSVGAVTAYTLRDLSRDHTVVALFELDRSSCRGLHTEGFEGETFPPSHWELLSQNQDKTWSLHALQSHTGTRAAYVNPDYSTQQDELLVTPDFHFSEGILHFWSKGSIYWCRDTFDNCDLEVWLILDDWDGGAGDDVLLGKAEDAWVDNYAWAASSYDLTPHLGEQTIRIGFRYRGLEGAQTFLDDVQICSDQAFPNLSHLPLLLE